MDRKFSRKNVFKQIKGFKFIECEENRAVIKIKNLNDKKEFFEIVKDKSFMVITAHTDISTRLYMKYVSLEQCDNDDEKFISKLNNAIKNEYNSLIVDGKYVCNNHFYEALDFSNIRFLSKQDV